MIKTVQDATLEPITTAANSKIRRYAPVFVLAVAIVWLVPITTQLTIAHMATMHLLWLAVGLPYAISRYWYRDGVISFPFRHPKRWWRSKILFYILTTGLLSYLVLPFYLTSTGAYRNWDVGHSLGSIAALFYGVNGLGVWDEFFFVTVLLAIARLFVPFWYANVAVAAIWTGFLYRLAFRSWGLVAIFVFALVQGYIFKRTRSLDYLLTIHLTIDFFLFLALVHATYPQWLRIFIWN